MRQSIFIIIFIVAFAYSTSANSGLELYKDNYHIAETFQAKTNISLLRSSDVVLLFGNDTFSPGALIVSLGHSAGIYFEIPKSYMTGKYTITAEDSNATFFISNTIADFSVKPAFIYIDKNEEFSLMLKNNLQKDIMIKVDESPPGILPARERIYLPVSSYRYLKFYIVQKQLNPESSINISSNNTHYTIPLMIKQYDSGKPTNESNTSKSANQSATPKKLTKRFRIAYEKINPKFIKGNTVYHTVNPKDTLSGKLYIENLGSAITVTASPSESIAQYLDFPEGNSINLLPGSLRSFTVLFHAPEREGNYSGYLLLSSGNLSEKINLTIIVSSLSEDNEKVENKTSKTQLQGKKLHAGFKLKDKISINLSKLKTKNKEGKPADIMIGMILTIILIAIIFIVVYILNKKSPPKPFIESIRKKH